MERRQFHSATGGIALVSSSCGHGVSEVAAATPHDPIGQGVQSNDGVVIHPWESIMLRGLPPPPEKQVAREIIKESRDELRWAAQHHRELLPTQRVTRADSSLIPLSRNYRDIMGLGYQDTAGQSTTLAQQLHELSVDAFAVFHRGNVICEKCSYRMRPETPHFVFSKNKSIASSFIATLLNHS